jgi:erythromycin esterase
VSGFELAADSARAFSGTYSARLRNTGAADTVTGPTNRTLPPDLVRGKRVTFSAAIRTEGVETGYASLWLRVDGADGQMISIDNASRTRGSTDWVRGQIERSVSSSAATVYFGFFLQGKGSAWFDDMRIEIDGVPITQTAPLMGEPSSEQLEWLRTNAMPFATERAGSGFDDLQGLKTVVGDARIVALGEATHGTAEFFRMKHRLTEFLANEMGFSIFSIEANMPESYRMNDYVLTGRGDPREILRGMYFWTWQTEEVLAMVQWMREFNAGGRGRIQFTGFDMQTWTVAGQIVRSFVEGAEPEYVRTVDEAWAQIRDTQSLTATSANLARITAAAKAAESVRVHLEENAKRYLDRFTPAEVEWAVQNARVVEQTARRPIGGSTHRDEMMATNTKWILDQNPGAKAVLWAHNYHVSRQPGSQGSYLAKWYGADYVVLGFGFHEGRYTAVTSLPGGGYGVLTSHQATPSFPGSVEYVFHATGMPRFILDWRKAKAENAGAWLLTEMEFREIGSVQTDGFALRGSLTTDYDALIFFDSTTASELLR